MLSIRRFLIIILCFAFIVPFSMAASGGGAPAAEGAEKVDSGSEAAPEGGGVIRLGGDYGKGTDPVHFDDMTLIATPVPTPTVDVAIEKEERKAWDLVRNTRDLIIRCRTDLKRYEKFMRKEFMEDLNKMHKTISGLHTYAVLHKRDEVEHVWAQAADKAVRTLAISEEYSIEFQENYADMAKNQEEAERILKKHSAKIQQPFEIKRELEANKKEMFFIKKKIDYFDALFREYAAKYNKAVDDREKRVAKLIKQHEDLHRP